LAVFVLASHEMAVSPFHSNINQLIASLSFIRRRIVSAPELCLAACALQHRGSV